jgi:hypothetical protein
MNGLSSKIRCCAVFYFENGLCRWVAYAILSCLLVTVMQGAMYGHGVSAKASALLQSPLAQYVAGNVFSHCAFACWSGGILEQTSGVKRFKKERDKLFEKHKIFPFIAGAAYGVLSTQLIMHYGINRARVMPLLSKQLRISVWPISLLVGHCIVGQCPLLTVSWRSALPYLMGASIASSTVCFKQYGAKTCLGWANVAGGIGVAFIWRFWSSVLYPALWQTCAKTCCSTKNRQHTMYIGKKAFSPDHVITLREGRVDIMGLKPNEFPVLAPFFPEEERNRMRACLHAAYQKRLSRYNPARNSKRRAEFVQIREIVIEVHDNLDNWLNFNLTQLVLRAASWGRMAEAAEAEHGG